MTRFSFFPLCADRASAALSFFIKRLPGNIPLPNRLIISTMILLVMASSILAQQMNSLIGVNLRREDPLQYIDFAGFVREYHDWVIDEGDYSSYSLSPFVAEPSLPYPCNLFRWNPPYQNQTHEHFDQFYQNIASSCNSCDVVATLKGALPYLSGGNTTANMEFIPVKTNFTGAPRVDVIVQQLPTGGNQGEIELVPCGGIGDYQFSINGGSSFADFPLFTGLPAGIYILIVKDSRGHNGVLKFILNDDNAPVINTDNTTITSATCGQSNGSITISASGGTPTYEYSLDGSTWQTNATFTGLSSSQTQNHIAYVRGSDGRVGLFPFIVNSNTSMTANVAVTEKPTGGSTNGILTVSAVNGGGTYQYSLDGGTFQSGNVFNMVGSGFHKVTVKNASNCFYSVDVLMNDVTPTNEAGGYSFEQNTADPTSYIEFADWAYQFTLRYGNTPYSPFPEEAKFHPDETESTGLGAVQYVEIWNEQDKDWFGGLNQFVNFTADDYAALYSAAWDGHEGALQGAKPGLGSGYDVGVKSADGNMTIVHGGISEFAADDWDYLLAIRDKVYERGDGGTGMFNIINFHHYCDNFWLGVDPAGAGVSPEEDNSGGTTFKKRMVDIRADVNTEFSSNAQLWLSEFGWDTNGNSPQRAPVITGNSEMADPQEVQGRWLTRAYMDVAAAGWDRAAQFCIRDSDSSPNPASGGLFEASGLVKDKANGYAPKKSYYYVSTLTNVLGDRAFCQELNAFDEEDSYSYKEPLRYSIDEGRPRAYLFRDGGGCSLNGTPSFQSGDVIAIWFPSSENQSDLQYSFTFPGLGTNVSQAVLIEMEHLDKDGRRSNVSISSNTVTIPVSERPIFLLLGPGETSPSPTALCPVNLSSAPVSCDAVSVSWSTPSGFDFDHYKIYYYEKNDSEEGGNPPVFDLNDPYLKLYADNVPANACNQVIISGLDKMNDRYWVYVIGVVVEEINDVVYYHISDPDCGRAEVVTALCFGGMAINTQGAPSPVQAMFNYDDVEFCHPQREPVAGGWDYFDYNSATNNAILTLPSDFYIYSIALLDGTGVGEFTIEYSPDASGTNWLPLNGLNPYLTVYVEEWRSFPVAQCPASCGTSCTTMPIRRLRFTKDAMANIRRVVLYGRPVSGTQPELECCGTSNAIVLDNTTIDDEIGISLEENYEEMHGEEFVVSGTLTVNVDYGFSGAKVYMMPGASIVIDPNHEFIIESGSVLEGCEEMWSGIQMQPKSKLLFDGSTIRDAMYGIAVNRASAQTPQTHLTVRGSLFEKNYIGIKFHQNQSGKDVSSLSQINGTVFDGNGTNLKDAYQGQPEHAAYSAYGIHASNLNLLTLGASKDANLFQRLTEAGIYGYFVNYNIRNSKFRELPPAGISGAGYGIHTIGGRVVEKGLGKSLVSEDPLIFDPAVQPTFEKVLLPIYMFGSAYDIQQNKIVDCPAGIRNLHNTTVGNVISDNYMNVYGTGIYIASPYFRDTKFERNFIENYTNKPGDGIYVSDFDSGLKSRSVSILENRIRVGFGANSAGIRVLGTQSSRVEDNIVVLTGYDQSDIVPTYGIYAANADGVIIRTNNVQGNGSPTVVADCFGGAGPDCEEDVLGAYNSQDDYCSNGSDGIPDCENDCDNDGVPNWADCSTNAIGIFILSSDMLTVQCNKVDGTVTGIALAEPCQSVDGIKGNQMDALATGLWFMEGALTGIQTDQGNAWLEEFDTYLGKAARHWSDNEINWLASQFIVESGDNMYNPSSGSQTEIYLFPEAADDDWFLQSGNSHFVCPELPPCVTGEEEECDPRDKRRQDNLDTNGISRYVINGGLDSSEMTAATRWNLDRHIYRNIKEEYLGQISDTTLAGFAQDNISTTVGEFYEVESNIADFPFLDSINLQQLQDWNLDLTAYMDSLALTTEQLSDLSLSDLRAWLRSNSPSGPPTDFMSAVWQIDSTLKVGKIAAAATLAYTNNAITTTEDYEDYEAMVNDIFLFVIRQDVDTLTTQQLSTVLTIAALCPSEGGEAVFKARYLYNTYVDPQPLPEWDMCYGLEPQLTSRAIGKAEVQNSEESFDVVVFPNPASNSIVLATSFNVGSWFLSDYTGRVVRQGKVMSNKQEIQLTGLPTGMYFLLASDVNNRKMTKKVLIIN